MTAVARLETDGLSLGPVEHQYYATVLAVTGRERSTLSAEERDALSKALRALGWRATEAALLCTPELPACLSVAVLRSYVRALNTEAVVLLERDILADPPQLPWIKVAVCDDFFGSLDDTDKKRAAWEQLQAARRILALTE
ncbi:MAG: hypothetical protein FWC48_00970 [Actinomycetia bacterium]|nr:hypothetical protein [Actinomycetes bacterium]